MGGASSPCASCKLLRRRCATDCIFAPYFPSDDPHKFAIVHKVFGASNISKMLQELPVHQRTDAVSSLVYEANARGRDPVYGCVGAISYLQNQVSHLQMQLAVAQAEILCIQMQHQQGQQAAMAAAFAMSPVVLDDEEEEDDRSSSSFLIQNNVNRQQSTNELLNFGASTNNGNDLIYFESFKKESSYYGHDMVS